MKTKDSDSGMRVAALEAFLFLYGEPVTVARIAKALRNTEAEIQDAVGELERELTDERRGIFILKKEDSVQLATKPAFADLLERLVKDELREELTPAALETLALVAYAGPIARSEIDYVRGVNSSYILRALCMRGLIERSSDPEHTLAYRYRPSFEFLRYVGVKAAEALPEYERIQSVVAQFRSLAQASEAKQREEAPTTGAQTP